MIQKNSQKGDLETETVQLFVGGMHQGCSIVEIEKVLSLTGEYIEFSPILDNRNLTRGYAFMKVPSSSVGVFLGKKIRISNSYLFINKAKKKNDDESLSKRVYFMKDQFNSTPLDVSALQSYFTQFGKITDFYLFKNHLGQSKGYGFCDF